MLCPSDYGLLEWKRAQAPVSPLSSMSFRELVSQLLLAVTQSIAGRGCDEQTVSVVTVVMRYQSLDTFQTSSQVLLSTAFASLYITRGRMRLSSDLLSYTSPPQDGIAEKIRIGLQNPFR